MTPITFAMIGAGWRSEFYFRICRELPDRFKISGVFVRDAAKVEDFEKRWGIRAYSNLDELLLRTNPSFAVVSVPWGANPGMLVNLAERGVPVLSETPPAPDLAALVDLHHRIPARAKIQVAEQYQYQPLNAAILATVDSGALGAVSHAQVSVAHGYHGMSMLRKALGVGFQNAEIQGIEFNSPIVTGPGRDGAPKTESISKSSQVIATLKFGDKVGVFDFTGDQYFSWIRSRRMLVRGERGEINNNELRRLIDFQTPVVETLTRVDAGQDGNLEGYYHKGILAGGAWLYRNPFAPGRLSDDEIAIAACLQNMQVYVDGGPEFYSVAEASQDHYLGLELDKAISLGSVVITQSQCWAPSISR